MSKKIVVITGASRGLGLEFTRQFAQHDDTHVVAVVRNIKTSTLLDDLVAGGNVTLVEVDMAKPETFDAAAAQIGGVGGKVDILINNAGAWFGAGSNISKDVTLGTPDEWSHTYLVDTIGPVFFTKALLPLLSKGDKKQVISLSSFLGAAAFHQATDGNYGFVSYATAKAALNFANLKYHLQFKDQGYTFITLNPGLVATDLVKEQGIEAPLVPEGSVGRMKSFIDRLTPAESGGDYSLDGSKDLTLTH